METEPLSRSELLEKRAAERRERLQISDQFVRTLLDMAPNSTLSFQQKEASAMNNMLRRKVREAGIARQILIPDTCTNADLHQMPGSERLTRLRYMEGDIRGGVVAPFGAPVDAVQFEGTTFLTEFHRIQTPEFYKDTNELRIYEGKLDLVKWVQDLALLSLQTTEDQMAWAMFDQIVGPLGGVGGSGFTQNHLIETDITPASYPHLQSILEDEELNNGIFVMNRRTAKKFMTNWSAETFGPEMARDVFTNGTSALKAKIHGIPHLFTMKRSLVPDDVVYIFAEQDYLGWFDVLEEPKLYVRKERDFIYMSALETISIACPQARAIQRVEFRPS